jgi:hypothetical protein
MFQFFLTLAVYCVSTPSILLTCVHVTWLVHKWSCINTCAICIIYILFINSNELSVLVLFSRSQDFIPGITFKDVLRFEERNKNVFFLILRGIGDSAWKKNRRLIINDYSTSIQWNHGLCKYVSKFVNLGCVLHIYT